MFFAAIVLLAWCTSVVLLEPTVLLLANDWQLGRVSGAVLGATLVVLIIAALLIRRALVRHAQASAARMAFTNDNDADGQGGGADWRQDDLTPFMQEQGGLEGGRLAPPLVFLEPSDA